MPPLPSLQRDALTSDTTTRITSLHDCLSVSLRDVTLIRRVFVDRGRFRIRRTICIVLASWLWRFGATTFRLRIFRSRLRNLFCRRIREYAQLALRIRHRFLFDHFAGIHSDRALKADLRNVEPHDTADHARLRATADLLREVLHAHPD